LKDFVLLAVRFSFHLGAVALGVLNAMEVVGTGGGQVI
jgi:hypothetical protein